jgi:hypothetical protein
MAEREKLRPHIVFGDGTFALFSTMRQIDVIDEETKVKESFLEFFLRPTTKARLKWNVKETDEDFINKGDWAGYYRKKYKKDYCQPLDLSPDSAVWLLSCDYKNNFIDIYNGKESLLLERINNLKKQRDLAKASANSLSFEMVKILKNPLSYMKKYGMHIKDLLDNVAGPIMPPPEGGGPSE